MILRSCKRLDFTKPFQGRKWLSLLQEDPVSGIRIKANLNLPSDYLGFSFDSNNCGLRGPCGENAQAFVLGTSYAMGFAVDNGQNWYDQLLREDLWLNLGLPVGPSQWHALFRTIRHSAADLALFLYHPNTWAHALAYQRWEHSGGSVFNLFGWKTDLWNCLKLTRRRISERKRQLQQGTQVLVSQDSSQWLLNSTYSILDLAKTGSELDIAANATNLLLDDFPQVICVRVPIKEQLIPAEYINDHFGRSLGHYDEMWSYTKRVLSKHRNIVFRELEGFELSDIYGFDTHLTTDGNQRLRHSLRELLSTTGFGEYCIS